MIARLFDALSWVLSNMWVRWALVALVVVWVVVVSVEQWPMMDDPDAVHPGDISP